jgi:excisionase family DNA binding protein
MSGKPAISDDPGSNPIENQEPFVTPEEAAAFLRMSPITIKKMAREGKLPAHPIGEGPRKRWRFRISELASHMSSRVKSVVSSVRALRRKTS